MRWLSAFTSVLLVLTIVFHSVSIAAAPAIPMALPESFPFADAGSHWARDAILWLAQRGIVNGSWNEAGQRVALPDARVTRAEVVKIVAGLKGIEPADNARVAFTDSASHWANGYLSAAKAAGIALGYPDGTFRPDSFINRAEMAEFIVRAFADAGLKGQADFHDLAATHWAYAAIGRAAGQGWIRGFSDRTFRPEQQATRAEAFTVLQRVDEQQAWINTVKSLGDRQIHGQPKALAQRAVSTLEPFSSQIPMATELSNMRSDLAGVWGDSERIPSDAVIQHQIALIDGLISLWTSGKLKKPVTVVAAADLLMATRLGAETAVADAEMVVGLSGRVDVRRPSNVTPLDWNLAKDLAVSARRYVDEARNALAAANASGAVGAFLTAWQAGTRAVTLAGVRLVPGGNSDLDSDGVPDDLELRFGGNPLLADTDGDGLSDVFEITYGGPLFQPGNSDTDGDAILDGDEDTDKDGLTNLQEQKAGTHPLRADTDGDGVTDGEELRLATNPLSADTDGDGMQDGAEIRLGTNPRVSDATRQVTTRVETGNGSVSITGLAGSVAQVAITVKDQTPYAKVPGLVSRVTQFSASGPFAQARIDLPVDLAKVPGKDLQSLRVFYFDDQIQAWVPVSGKQGFDPATGRAWAETTHFTSFAVFYVPEWNATWSVQQCTDRAHEQVAKAVDVVLAIDQSPSMRDNDPDDLRKIGAMRMSLALLKDDRAAVVAFDQHAEVLQSLTHDMDAVRRAVIDAAIGSGTSVDGGLRAGVNLLSHQDEKRARIVVLLTDGQNAPDPFDPDVIDETVKAGVTVFTIGLGDDIDKAVLETIAGRTGGRFFQVRTAADLPTAFERVTAKMGLTDTDGDGLSDCEEIQGMLDASGRRWFSDPNKADSDGDGLTDRQEMGQQIEPVLSHAHPYPVAYWMVISDPRKADTDGDGLNDRDERKLHTSPFLKDTDDDGLADEQELALKTDPLKQDTDGDTISDGDEVYSLYLNPLLRDERLVTSDEWAVEYYKGYKLGTSCNQTADRNDLRRCLGSLAFKAGQATAQVAALEQKVAEAINAASEFAIGFAGVIGDHLVNMTGRDSFRLDAYYGAPDSEAIRMGEVAGDWAMGFALQFVQNQADIGNDIATFIFGADFPVGNLRDYMNQQSQAFRIGRTSSNYFQTLSGAALFLGGIVTILMGAIGGTGGVVAEVAAAPVSGGFSLVLVPATAATAVEVITAGAAMASTGVLMMLAAGEGLSRGVPNVSKGSGMTTRDHSRKLGKDLEYVGEPKPGKDYQAAHISPSGLNAKGWGQRARDVLKRVGIDIDGARNGVWLHKDFHLGPGMHNEQAIRYVAQTLEEAERLGTTSADKLAKVERALADMKRLLSKGIKPWEL